MFNPGMIFKIKNAWTTFTNNHPKFQPFLMAAKGQIVEGTIIEVSIITPVGDKINTNLKITASDLELFESMKDMAK